MIRRELLRLASASSAAAMVAGSVPVPARASSQAEHAAVAVHLWRLYARLETKADVLPAVAEHLASMRESLSAHASPGLCAIHSEVLQLAGEALFDAGHHDDAISSYVIAASAAGESGDFDRWAAALVRYSLVLNAEARWEDSRDLLVAAARVAARGDSALPTRSWVASVRAEVAAAQGDADETERALDEAGSVVSLTAPGGWLRYDGGRLPEQRVSAYLALGRYDQAERELSAIDLSGPPTGRRKGALLIDQVRLAVARHAPESARAPLEAVVVLAARTRSGYLTSKLELLRTELEGRAGTADLVETLRGIHE